MDNLYDICKATIKIMIKNRIGSGFFIKIERNNKILYCIMTNQHIIDSNMIKNKDELIIIYENEKKYLRIKLDKKERIIECFDDSFKIDVVIIEIIKKDNIDDSYFLLPNLDIKTSESIINKEIQVLQYFGGKCLTLTMGQITGISSENDYFFYHNADTTFGSSGSPIVLKGENKVIAIHKGAKDNKINIGIFIKKIIIDLINKYKNEYIQNETQNQKKKQKESADRIQIKNSLRNLPL